ncbi:MAG TPA: Uma2 family endonuclease [Pyrinomonadaceae bacterium]|jgi:Uma2 family endonuclease|nr:Uma2 family endonuclease [Pyrinomonadaceae bacterium]
MSRQTKTRLTPQEYLAQERRAEYKSEYFNGEVFAMTGASRRHNLITTNIVRELSQQLKRRPCEVYPSDMRVRVPDTNLYTYPDIVVVCGEPKFEDDEFDTLLNPTLIVEVLSKSTAAYDRTIKFGYYRTIESLAEYLLVAQDEYMVEQYTRQTGGGWLLSDFRSPGETITLTSVQCALPLAEIYDKVSFQPPASNDEPPDIN